MRIRISFFHLLVTLALILVFLNGCGGEPISFEIYLKSGPSGAEVYLDGKKLGSTPITVKIEGLAKNHKVELEKQGYQSKIVTVFISPGHAVDQQYPAIVNPDGTWEAIENNTLRIVLEK